MSKFKLLVEEDYTYEALGMSCHLKDFRIAFLINKHLNYNLVRKESLVVTHKKGKGISHHALFKHESSSDHVSLFLLSNRGQEGYAVPAFNSFEFFFIVEGAVDYVDMAELIEGLSSIESVQLVKQLPSGVLDEHQFSLFD